MYRRVFGGGQFRGHINKLRIYKLLLYVGWLPRGGSKGSKMKAREINVKKSRGLLRIPDIVMYINRPQGNNTDVVSRSMFIIIDSRAIIIFSDEK